MRDEQVIAEFERYRRAITEIQEVVNMQTQHIVGCDARIRVWENMLLSRGGFLRLAIKNIFAPDAVRLEIITRFHAASQAHIPAVVQAEKPEVEIVKVKSDEELQAALKGEK
jgi:hypothetical protein